MTICNMNQLYDVDEAFDVVSHYAQLTKYKHLIFTVPIPPILNIIHDPTIKLNSKIIKLPYYFQN